MVTPFSAEETLPKTPVPVNVGRGFYLGGMGRGKNSLEVEDYRRCNRLGCTDRSCATSSDA